MALTIGSRHRSLRCHAPSSARAAWDRSISATDTKLNRQVALKILPEAFATDPDRLARFQREAQVLASLNHPNIAQIHGIEEAEGTRALVLELVGGADAGRPHRQRSDPYRRSLPIAKQMLRRWRRPMKLASSHRDLKPANIKVKDGGHCQSPRLWSSEGPRHFTRR